MLSRRQKAAGLVAAAYVVCGVILCYLVLDRRHCNSSYYYIYNYKSTTSTTTTKGTTTTTEITTVTPTTTERLDSESESDVIPSDNPPALGEQRFEDRFCAGGYHGLCSLLGTLIMGFGIMMFRLLNGIRTRIVNYIHLGLHVITFILFSVGLWCINIHEYSITYDRINDHGVTSWFIYGMFCGQSIGAILIFVYFHPSDIFGGYATLFHDLFGIWLFLCCVGCCISGRRRAEMDYVGINLELFCGISYVCFMCCFIFVISPFFEWDLVGSW